MSENTTLEPQENNTHILDAAIRLAKFFARIQSPSNSTVINRIS